jgi:hypothetical protein
MRKYSRVSKAEFELLPPKLLKAWNWASNGLNVYATVETAKSLLPKSEEQKAREAAEQEAMAAEAALQQEVTAPAPKKKKKVSSKRGKAYDLNNWNEKEVLH